MDAADRYVGMHAEPWPDPLTGPWLVRFHWGEVDGRVECIGLDVRSFRSKEGSAQVPRPMGDSEFQAVTTTLLRSLNADGLISDARDSYRDLAKYAATLTKAGAKARREAARVAETMQTPRRKGRPPAYTINHYEQVAKIYSEAHALGRTPRRAVARHFNVPETTASHWIGKARKLGLLGQTIAGKAGGVQGSTRSEGEGTLSASRSIKKKGSR